LTRARVPTERPDPPPDSGSGAEPLPGDPEVSTELDAERELTYSVRLTRPFLRVLRPMGSIPRGWAAELEALDIDARLPMAVAHQMLEAVVQVSQDPTLGLKAARERSPGEAGVLDHAISSASTVREAIETASRYVRLVNEALELRLVVVDDTATVRFDNRVPLPRAALEFELGAIYQAFGSLWAAGARDRLRVLIGHEAPADLEEYTRTFGSATLEFGAPFYGFSFDAARLEAGLVSSESRLHDVILKHAEKMLEELPRKRNLAERVRSAIAAELEGGNPSVVQVARRFHMSPRTLERRLEREGAMFSNLLEEVRRTLALRYVARQDLELAEIAFLLGYSQTTAFHRAFKRWTGETPLQYRRARR
jgi:AraC-like DNA-binding protein